MKVLKWIGIVVLILIVIVAGGISYMSSKASDILETTFDITPALSAIKSDSTAIADGEHLSKIYGCQDCHGADLAGQVMVDAPPFGITATNLTAGAGGIGSNYSIEDWDRAIRHGVRPGGTALAIMPSSSYNKISDGDMNALLSYIKSVPSVDNELPATEIRLIGKMLILNGELDAHAQVSTDIGSLTRPETDTTLVFGEYLVSIDCMGCHGADLKGGPPVEPETPPAPDLTAAANWPLEDFTIAMRSGKTPDGRELIPRVMPWQAFQHFTDVEMKAIYMYLQENTR